MFTKILPHSFSQLVTVATRHSRGKDGSGLDHYYTNRPEKLSNVSVSSQGNSDHSLISATRFTKSIQNKPRYIRKRIYKNFNKNDFINAVRKLSWWDIYQCEDVEEAVKILTNNLNGILDTMAPIKKVQVRTKYAVWLSNSTKEKMKLRDTAKKKAQETNNDEDWKRYKHMRNNVTNILKNEKTNYQKQKIIDCCDDTGSVWKNVKTFLGWSSGGSPTQLIDTVSGKLVTKPSELVKIMNDFFINKVKELRRKIPITVGDPLNLVRNLMRNRNCTLILKAVHPDDINKIISKLSNKKSCGLDNIDSFCIKLVKDELVPALTHITNLSIQQKLFPMQWKRAKVIPLHKKDDKNSPKNYRPVALLSVFSKIVERAIFQQIIQYLEDNNLLHPSHHGFRTKHNTATALLQMFDTWIDALENNDISAVIMLDLSAAFDVVDHSILIEKIKLYGFQDCISSWIKSYLSDRSQCVYIDGVYSEMKNIEAGVPQGSILGPLLYIIFTNDLPEILHNHPPLVNENNLEDQSSFFNVHCDSCGGICCFADDSTYTKSGKDPVEIQNDIEGKYKDISEYMSQNKLVLNTDKTHLIIMTSSKKHRTHNDYNILLNTGSEIIEPIKCEKLLGGSQLIF